MAGALHAIASETGWDPGSADYIVGTSAGSMVAAHLVAGRTPRRPAQLGGELALAGTGASNSLASVGARAARRAGAMALNAGSAFAPLALGLSAPGGALLRAGMLRALPRPADTLEDVRRQVAASGARFDGRLRVAAVDRRSGRRVMFGSPRAPVCSVAEAVSASCSVPWLFAPVRIQGRDYVDGGVWSATNLDGAPAGLHTHVLCLNPTANIAGTHSMIALIRSVARSAVSVEAMAVRRRGAAVQTVAPSMDAAAAMGTNFMDREPRERTLVSGYRQGIALAGS